MTPVEKLQELKSFYESLYHEEEEQYIRNIYKHKIDMVQDCINAIR